MNGNLSFNACMLKSHYCGAFLRHGIVDATRLRGVFVKANTERRYNGWETQCAESIGSFACETADAPAE